MISNQNANIKNPFEKREEDPNKRSILSLVKNTELITIDFKVVGHKVIKSYWSDSILNYFSSENFNIHQLVYNLGHRQEKGITDFLMNLMSEKLINQSFYYLPQLIILLSSKKYSKPIETFLLDRCIGQMKFSIIINWLVTACAEDMKIRGLTNKKYEKFQNRIEMTLVNGKRSTLSSYSLYNLKRRDTQYQILKGSLDKEQRLNYYNQVIIFYTTLKSLCMKLKEYPRETVQGQEKLNRNYVLRDNLKRYNDNIENLYEKTFGPEPEIKNDLNDFFRGILLPLNDSEFVDDEYNNIIVRIKPEYCMCFSTKARVPVKLVVECVRVGECKNWASLYIQEKKEDKKEENAEEEVDVVKGRSKTKNDPKNKNEDSNQLNTGCVTNNYGSLDEFFKKLDLEEREAKERERKERERKNIEEINKILNDVKFANEHPEMEKNFTFSQPFGYSQSGRSSNLSKQRNTVSYMIPNPEEPKEEFLCEDTALEDNPFGKKWSEITSTIQESSPVRNFETYSIKTFIAKADDDLRQEVMTMQLIQEFDRIFREGNTNLKLRPYEILITSSSSGLIEFLPNTISIDGLKKKIINTNHNTLNSFFRYFFGNNLEEAQKNFAESLAAYSVVSYLINIKDRHNGNILLDMNGHIIHIDFGFILGISPGNMNFENAPFKLTNEYVEILDGETSPLFDYYKSLMVKGFMEARKNYETFETIIYTMANGANSYMPCFVNRNLSDVMRGFKERFHFEKSEMDYITVVNDLVKDARGNWRTTQYDYFQKLTNGILP